MVVAHQHYAVLVLYSPLKKKKAFCPLKRAAELPPICLREKKGSGVRGSPLQQRVAERL